MQVIAMIQCNEMIKKLEMLSPPSFAEGYDNVGLLLGSLDASISSVLIALDASKAVVEEAVRLGVDMLLTHHPMIFRPLKSIRSDHFIGKKAIDLITHGICCYAMHTNFDIIGMADAAADEMALKNRQVLHVTCEDEIAKEGIGRYGALPFAMNLKQCAYHVKKVFALEEVRVYGDGAKIVETAAICPGSGKSVLKATLDVGADVLVTSEIDHNDAIDAMDQGLSIIDAGHYGLEKIFVPYMKEYIEREMPGLTVHTAREAPPFWSV